MAREPYLGGLPMNLLPDKTAVITGGASGNGRAMGKLFAENGADVVIADIREDPRSGGTNTHEWIEDETGASATFVDCNVKNLDDLEQAVDAAEEFGGVDIMVNDAGIFRQWEFFDVDPDDYSHMMDINVRGVYFGSQVAAERMVETSDDDDDGEVGNIINLSSYMGLAGASGLSTYNTSKGAVRLITYALADELAPHGIRTNALHPGVIDTQMNREDVPIIDSDTDMAEQFLSLIPMGRWGQPEEVGKAALFLASDLASYVNGESLVVGGGLANTK